VANEQVTVRFAAEIQQYQANVKQAQKLLNMFGISAEQEANRVSKSVASMIAQYASLTLAINAVTNVVKEGINFNKFVEVSTAAFGTMMKSVSGAKAVMQDLFNFAVNSPLTFKETVASSRQLMAYGFQVKELIPTIQMLGTVGKATGVALDDMAYVYGTLRSQGRAYTRDLMQFAMRGIPIYEELAKVMGRPVQDLQKLTEAGKIGFKEVEKAFQNMTSGTGKFAGYFDEYMKTFEGKMSMLSDIAQQASGTLTESLFGVLKKNVDDFISILKNNKSMISSVGTDLGKLASAFFDIVKALIPLIPLLLKLIPLLIAKEAISAGLKIWKALPEVFNALGASVGLATGGLKALAAGGTFVPGMTSSVAMLGRATEGFATSLALIPKILVGILPELAAVAAGIALIAYGINKIKSDAKRAETDKAFAANELEKYMTSGRLGKGSAGMFGINAESAQVSAMARQFSLSKMQAAEVLLKVNEITKATYDQIVAETESLRIEQMRVDSAKAYAEYNSDAAIALRAAQKAIIDEDAWAKAMKEFNKYKDDYEKWVASRSDDPYAVLEYEYNKNKQILQEKLGAYPKLYNTAVDWITKIYQYERDQIGATEAMKSKYGKYTGLISSGQTSVDQAFSPEKSMVNQVQTALSEMDRILAGEEDVYMENLRSQLSAILPLLQEIQRLSDKELWKTIQSEIAPPLSEWEQVESKFNEYSAKIGKMDMTPKERADAEVALWKWSQGEKARITAEQNKKDTAQMVEGFKNAWDEIEAYRAGLRSTFSNVTEGSTTLVPKLQEQAGAFFRSGNWLEGLWEGFKATVAGGNGVVGTSIRGFAGRKEEGMGNGLNGIMTALSAMGGPVKMLIDFIIDIVTSAKPITDLLKTITTSVTYALMPVIEDLGKWLSWLYDSIIVPVGNMLIDIINAVIRGINNTLGKWMGFHINEMNHLLTTTEALAKAQEDAAKQTKLNASMDALSQTLDYLKNKLNDAIDTQVKSLQDLYEVGAISATDYQNRAGALNAQRPAGLENMVSTADQQLNTMREVSLRIQSLLELQTALKDSKLTDDQKLAQLTAAGISDSIKPLINTMSALICTSPETVDAAKKYTAAKADYTNLQNQIQMYADEFSSHPEEEDVGVELGNMYARSSILSQIVENARLAYLKTLGTFATGTGSVPQDMPANVHKGEMIIPSDFSSAIRRGDLSLSGSGSSSGSVNVVVNVAGSVKEENDLAISIANAIYKQRRSGVLTV
jgi:hypothetical protein